jgi:hypothetical protein
MEKIVVEKFKSRYVKLVKDTGEILDGAIVQVLDDSIIFQSEISRSGISLKSIREIMPIEEVNKRKKTLKTFKF